MYARKPRLDLTYGRLGEWSQHQTIKAINSGHFFQPNSICLIMQKVFLVSHVTKKWSPDQSPLTKLCLWANSSIKNVVTDVKSKKFPPLCYSLRWWRLQYALYEYLKTLLTNAPKRLIFTCNSNSALCKNLRHYNNYDVTIFFPLLSIPVFASELNQLADLSQTTRNLLLQKILKCLLLWLISCLNND